MKTVYLYGDATVSPLQIDFIAFLPDAVDFAVRALLCTARIDDAMQRVARLTEDTEKEIEGLQALAADLLASLDRTEVPRPDSPIERCAAHIRDAINEKLRVEVDGARATVAAEVALADQTAAGERIAFAGAFDGLVLRHAFHDASETIEIRADGSGRYGACLRSSTPYGLNWTTTLDIPPTHPLGRFLRLERVIERIEVEAPEPAGWLRRELRVRTQRLDRLHLVDLCVGPGATVVRLRAAAGGSGGGFDLTFGEDPNRVQIVRVCEGSGPPDSPYEATPDDSSVLDDLHQQLRAMAVDLLRHKKSVVEASLDDRPLGQLASPRILVERLIASLAPIVQEIGKRSLAPGELVLKRQTAENQREELFISKAALQHKLQALPSALRRWFESFDLAGQRPAAPEPFALLHEPRGWPHKVGAINVPAPGAGEGRANGALDREPRVETQGAGAC